MCSLVQGSGVGRAEEDSGDREVGRCRRRRSWEASCGVDVRCGAWEDGNLVSRGVTVEVLSGMVLF